MPHYSTYDMSDPTIPAPSTNKAASVRSETGSGDGVTWVTRVYMQDDQARGTIGKAFITNGHCFTFINNLTLDGVDWCQ